MHHAHARAALATALGALDAAVVERDREAVAGLGVELGEVAAARQRAFEHALGERGIDEARSRVRRRHGASPLRAERRRGLLSASDSSTRATMRSAVWSNRS